MLPKMMVVVTLCVLALSVLTEAPGDSDEPVDEVAEQAPVPAPAAPRTPALAPPPVVEHLERTLDLPAPRRVTSPPREASPPPAARPAPPVEPAPAPVDTPPDTSPPGPVDDGFAPVLPDVPIAPQPYVPPTPEEFRARFPLIAQPPPGVRRANCPCYVPPPSIGKPLLPGGPVQRFRLPGRYFRPWKETVATWVPVGDAVVRGARYEHLAFTGPGEVGFALKLANRPIVRAVLTARLSGAALPLVEKRYPSDVSVEVNGNNCGTQRVPAQDGAGVLRVWKIPPEALQPGMENTIGFRVCRNAVYAQGLSIYGRAVRREQGDATAVLELQYAASN